MNTLKSEPPESKQEILEKKRLTKVISEWVIKNKKIFWKYEVSCFYKTYVIRISNLPDPSAKDILLSSNNRLLGEQQRKQLCDAVAKVCEKSKAFKVSSVDIQIDYNDGAVTAEFLLPK